MRAKIMNSHPWIVGRKMAFVLPLCYCAFCATVSRAHVELNAPNGGEALNGGSMFLIEWMPAVAPHDTLNFDLWYSTETADGPWTVIVAGLPPGDLAIGSEHSHAWLLPNVTDASVWVRVRQENNVDDDYEDKSENSFSITAAASLTGDYNGNDAVDVADYTVWRNSLGQIETGLPADGNTNGRIDDGDYDVWKSHFAESLGAGGAAVVPEPSSILLVLLVCFLSAGAARLRRSSAKAAH
jgi:hypothetical protein